MNRQADSTESNKETQENSKEEAEEYVIDNIVSHGINEDSKHPSAKLGETTYRVRWHGYSPSDDTYELIHHLPRNKVVSYYKKKKLQLPSDLDKAQLG